jgi:hypothetical protein
MSTQQQIDAWNAAIVQKQQEKTGQETILKVQQEQLKEAETARINADLAVQRAQAAGASIAQVTELQRQFRLADSAESDARIAAGKTQSNIQSLDGSIRFNTSQRDQFQSALPARANPSSTVEDRPANAAANAAETAPVSQPIANTNSTTAPVSAIEQGGEGPAQRLPQPAPPQDFVTEEDGTFIPSDSSRAEERRAEIAAEENRVQPKAEAPRDFVRDPETGELVPSDSVQAEQIRTEQAAAADRVAVTAPAPVPSGEWTAVLNDGTGPGNEGTWYIVNETGEIYQLNIVDGNEARIIAENLSLGSTEALPQGTPGGTGLTPEEQLAKDQAAAKAAAINQATLNSVYNKAGSSDWRVRLQLAPTSDYLYNANPSGILEPLAATNGVIFPYTPQINTSYRANYEQYDLVHSNYRGVYYKNSRVDDLSIRAVFTAQDTREADYLLAVIHFFRSVTKMFYGKDEQRGSPPPLVYLSGLGMNQFFGHPCVVTSFQYNLPDNVDYIRASSVNNYGTDLLSRRTATRSSGTAGLGASGNRILNAGLERFFPGTKPAPDSVVASVNNTQLANYVPTKMEIDIALIPVQTRSQVSKQFSLKGFANGDLIKGGFW